MAELWQRAFLFRQLIGKGEIMNKQIDSENQGSVKRSNRIKRFGFIAAGIGLGSAVAYLVTKIFSLPARTEAGVSDNVVDDRGTGQKQAVKILRTLRDRAFEASDEKLAIALGRPVEEVAGWSAGQHVIDDDVVMKARGIAMNRGVHLE
jgi:hypothetical protein